MSKKNSKEHRRGFALDSNNFGRNRDYKTPDGERVADPKDKQRSKPDIQVDR